MLDGLHDCPGEPPALWQGDGVALGNRVMRVTPESAREAIPFVDDGAGLAITGDIRLDEREVLCRALGMRADTPDSRIVLASYQRWGSACVERLYGDFAFVVADLRRGGMFAARDVVGVCPLYYGRAPDGAAAVANDLRALRAFLEEGDGFEPYVDGSFAVMFLRDRWAWHPTATFDSRVFRVAPGHVAWFGDHRVDVRRWWPCGPPRTIRGLSLDDAVARIAPVVEASVRNRARTPGLVGVHVSGGLDSGLVAAHTARLLRADGRPDPVACGWTPTLTGESATKEEVRLRATATHLGLEVIPCNLTVDDMRTYLTQDPVDLPFENTFPYESAVLTGAAARGVTVMLSGWGGDEVVSSNGNHLQTMLLLEGRWAQLLAELPTAPIVNIVRWLLHPIREAWFGFPRVLIGAGVLSDAWRASKGNGGGRVRLPVRLRDRMQTALANGIVATRLESWAALGARHGVQYRFPLLDRRLIEQVLTFPHDIFRQGTRGREVMRELCKPWLPEVVWSETDKEDAHREALLVGLYDEALNEVARRLARGGASPARARYVNIPFVVRWLETGDVRRRALLEEVVRFLQVSEPDCTVAVQEEPRLLPLPRLGPVARLGLLGASVAYTPWRQLTQRVSRIVRRRVEGLTRAGRPHGEGASPARLRAGAPRPIFSTQGRIEVSEGSAVTLPLAYRDWPLALPADWHPPTLGRGTGLDAVMLHAFAYLGALPVDVALDLMCDWAARNGKVRESDGRDAWYPWAVSIRAVAWMQWLSLHRADVDDGRLALLTDSLSRQMAFLTSNLEEDICGNHLIKNIRALLWAAAALECADAAQWERIALGLLEREVAVQVLPDGVHFERSPSYHAQVLADLADCAWVNPHARALLEPVLARMAHALGWLVHPDGNVALLNDSTIDGAPRPEQIRIVLGEALGVQVSWGDGSFALESAGFYGMRNG
ncbi:MAG: hypothetical protein EB084_20450, partial [Proteobacteria bacterium]|nr:hypothetical protein [Pseudomonadota bacterium]